MPLFHFNFCFQTFFVSGFQFQTLYFIVFLPITGSAVCRNVSWQVCNDCSQDYFDAFPGTDTRVITVSVSNANANGNDISLKFIKTNNCNINDLFGIISFATMVFVVLSVYYLNYRQKKKMISIDEKQCTSADYTIEIKVS